MLSERATLYFGPIAHTAGFLDLLVRFIRELKRWKSGRKRSTRPPTETGRSQDPRGKQSAPAGPSQQQAATKQEELADLYAAYQDVLTRHELYDVEGRFWSARSLLRDGQTRPFDGCSKSTSMASPISPAPNTKCWKSCPSGSTACR